MKKRRQLGGGSSGPSSIRLGPAFEAQIQATQFTGPVPPPELMQQYEQVVPGMPARLLDEFESQSRHRRTIERTHIERSHARADRGQLMALIVILAGIGSGTWLTINDKSTEGLTAMFAPMAVCAALFVTGKLMAIKSQKEKREEVDKA